MLRSSDNEGPVFRVIPGVANATLPDRRQARRSQGLQVRAAPLSTDVTLSPTRPVH